MHGFMLEGIVPVLFLVSYCVHMIEEIMTLIQVLGINVFHIPGGCTGLVTQPSDIGFNL